LSTTLMTSSVILPHPPRLILQPFVYPDPARRRDPGRGREDGTQFLGRADQPVSGLVDNGDLGPRGSGRCGWSPTAPLRNPVNVEASRRGMVAEKNRASITLMGRFPVVERSGPQVLQGPTIPHRTGLPTQWYLGVQRHSLQPRPRPGEWRATKCELCFIRDGKSTGHGEGHAGGSWNISGHGWCTVAVANTRHSTRSPIARSPGHVEGGGHVGQTDDPVWRHPREGHG
jgi:hypothetical protein